MKVKELIEKLKGAEGDSLVSIKAFVVGKEKMFVSLETTIDVVDIDGEDVRLVTSIFGKATEEVKICKV